MVDRQRIRVGRAVSYNPTAAEVAQSGPGPYPALITDVDVNGAVDLLVHTPGDNLGAGVTAIASVAVAPPPTPADGAYVQAEATATADSIIELQAIAAAVRQHLLDTRKNAVTRGSAAGQYDYLTGPQAL